MPNSIEAEMMVTTSAWLVSSTLSPNDRAPSAVYFTISARGTTMPSLIANTCTASSAIKTDAFFSSPGAGVSVARRSSPLWRRTWLSPMYGSQSPSSLIAHAEAAASAE